jgi:hypothetical protein
VDRREEEADRLARLRAVLVEGILDAVPDAVPRGDLAEGGRLSGIAHLTFPGCEGDSLLYLLDARGVECSTGSACQAGVPQPSHVLTAMGVPGDEARGALRFSLGWTSTQSDVHAVVQAIGPVVERARLAGLTTLPGAAVRRTALPGTALPGTALPGTALPGTALPGTAPPGTALPGTAPPGTAPPGTAPPGTAPPGRGTNGSLPGGAGAARA